MTRDRHLAHVDAVVPATRMPHYELLSALFACVFASERAVAQIYRPIANNNMWDSYLFRDGEDYHLFYLQNENFPRVDPDRPSWLLASVGRAVSRDLVHWETVSPISFRSFDNDYDDARHMFIGQATAKWNSRYLFFYTRARES